MINIDDLNAAITHLENARRIMVLAELPVLSLPGKDPKKAHAKKEAQAEIDKAVALVHRCTLPDSIQEALNSGDGSYKP